MAKKRDLSREEIERLRVATLVGKEDVTINREDLSRLLGEVTRRRGQASFRGARRKWQQEQR